MAAIHASRLNENDAGTANLCCVRMQGIFKISSEGSDLGFAAAATKVGSRHERQRVAELSMVRLADY